MGLPIRRAALLLLSCLAFVVASGSVVLATAQPLSFGKPFPLTNTRYENLAVEGTFISNGSETFLVWDGGAVVRMTEVEEGPSRIGRAVLPAFNAGAPAAIWTGEHFLVAGSNRLRLLDPSGEPLGGPFTLVQNALKTRLASNGRNVMMLISTSTPQTYLYKLTIGGALIDPAAQFIDHPAAWDETAIASNGTGYAMLTGAHDGLRVTMLDENGAIRSQQLVFGSAHRRGPPVIASDGQRYLAVWNDGDETVRAVTIEANGTIGQPFVIATRANSALGVHVGSVVSTGDRFAVAVTHTNAVAAALIVSVRSVDATARTATAIADLPAFGYTRPSLAFSRNRLLLAWESFEGTLVRDLTGGGDAIRVAWAAQNQRVFGAATAADATMIVWAEDVPYAGLRRGDGTWVETPLTGEMALVASNGSEFVVITYGAPGSPATATRFDAHGSRYPIATAIPFHPTGVAWNGSEYTIVGTFGPDMVAARLSESDTLSPTVIVRHGSSLSFGPPQVASDGTNVFLAWGETEYVACFLPCLGATERVRTMLLTRDLRALTPPVLTTLATGEEQFDQTRVVWDGSQYVVVYGRRSGGLTAQRISRTGTTLSSITLTTGTSLALSVARVGNAAGISWRTSSQDLPVDEIRLVSDRVVNVGTFPRQSVIFDHALAPLPDGRLGFVAAERLDVEPYNGSERLTMTVGDVAPPANVPDAPRASVRVDGERLRVSWTAPPQPVNGYRLEYKVGGGEWTELERWFGASQSEVVLTLSPRRSTIYSFRLRAWSDSGTSAYSPPASVFLGKRRSVR